MARTPSMTTAECEAILGPRGALNVNADNRNTAKKWLVATGYPAAFVGGLSMFELAMAYNDKPDWREKLDKKLAEMRQLQADCGEDEPAAPVVPVDGAPVAAPVVASVNPFPAGNDAQAALQALSALFNRNALTETQIREIARHEVAQIAPRPIEVHFGNVDRPAVRIDEHVSPQFDRVLRLTANGANVLLVGPAGCGKTHMAEQVAKALGATYGAIHGSAGASESALTGWLLPVEGGKFEYCPSVFVSLYEQGESLFLCDELDAFDPNMLIVANGALANGHMHIPHRRHAPCVIRGKNARIMATANTYGTGANPIYAGRSPLDAATLDRFVIVTIDYDRNLESTIGAANGLDASEMASIWALRDKVRESALRRVVSTRAFQKAGIMKASGDAWSTVMNTLVEGWSRDERAKVGM